MLWEFQTLVDVEIRKLPLDVSVMEIQFFIIAQCQYADFVKPLIISCGGWKLEVFKA